MYASPHVLHVQGSCSIDAQAKLLQVYAHQIHQITPSMLRQIQISDHLSQMCAKLQRDCAVILQQLCCSCAQEGFSFFWSDEHNNIKQLKSLTLAFKIDWIAAAYPGHYPKLCKMSTV